MTPDISINHLSSCCISCTKPQKKACCDSQQRKALTPVTLPPNAFNCASLFSFGNKALRSVSSSKAGKKRLFIWGVEWWPVCHSNNISGLLSPAVMRGSANSVLAKVRSVWSAVYVPGVPSPSPIPGRPSLSSVAHTGHHTASAQYSLHSSQPTTTGTLGMFYARTDKEQLHWFFGFCCHTYLQFSCRYCAHSFLVFTSSLLGNPLLEIVDNNPLLEIRYFLNNGVMVILKELFFTELKTQVIIMQVTVPLLEKCVIIHKMSPNWTNKWKRQCCRLLCKMSN